MEEQFMARSFFSEGLKNTDPGFTEFFTRFSNEQVAMAGDLSPRIKGLAILASLLGSQGVEAYKMILPVMLEEGVTPIEVKEIVYQATAYLGIGRVYPFLNMTNEILVREGSKLPLEEQGVVKNNERILRGEEIQVRIFGDEMHDYHRKGLMEEWLTSNCYGDYYTRQGLTIPERELVTLCILASMGDCELQLRKHVQGNLRVENNKDFICKVLAQCVPYAGYPRILNAMTIVKEVSEMSK